MRSLRGRGGKTRAGSKRHANIFQNICIQIQVSTTPQPKDHSLASVASASTSASAFCFAGYQTAVNTLANSCLLKIQMPLPSPVPLLSLEVSIAKEEENP